MLNLMTRRDDAMSDKQLVEHSEHVRARTAESHYGRWIAIALAVAVVIGAVVLLVVSSGGGGSTPGY